MTTVNMTEAEKQEAIKKIWADQEAARAAWVLKVGVGAAEFGDHANAKHAIKQYDALIAKGRPSDLKFAATQAARVERARAFVADKDAFQIKRVITKPWTPTWSKDEDVAKFFGKDIAAILVKDFEMTLEVAQKAVADKLEEAISNHRAENEGEVARMGCEFWTDAQDDVAALVAELVS